MIKYNRTNHDNCRKRGSNHIKIPHGKGVSLMLVVGRKPGQSIVINENIIIKVIKSDEGQLRLAIEAPRDISIIRGELLNQE
jgi:carbon storage regulator